MKHHHLIGVLGAMLYTVITLPAHAALIGVLPATAGGMDWQAYYDDQLDITWAANANINGDGTWANQIAWAADIEIGGVTGWRLPNMDINGDDTIDICAADQAACKDNEYGHLYYYGAGTVFGSGITPSSTGPFSNLQSSVYWSGTEFTPLPGSALVFNFDTGLVNFSLNNHFFAWAVHAGNVSAVPVPAAVWLFGSGLMGLLGVARRQR